jgi:hypothetical protein
MEDRERNSTFYEDCTDELVEEEEPEYLLMSLGVTSNFSLFFFELLVSFVQRR